MRQNCDSKRANNGSARHSFAVQKRQLSHYVALVIPISLQNQAVDDIKRKRIFDDFETQERV